MKVLLRDKQKGLYYAGENAWVKQPESARDFGEIRGATQLAFQKDAPPCQLALPVSSEWYMQPPAHQSGGRQAA